MGERSSELCSKLFSSFKLKFHGTDTDTDTDTDFLADFRARILADFCPTRALFLARMSVEDARVYTCTCTVHDKLSCTRLQNCTIGTSLLSVSVSVSVPWVPALHRSRPPTDQSGKRVASWKRVSRPTRRKLREDPREETAFVENLSFTGHRQQTVGVPGDVTTALRTAAAAASVHRSTVDVSDRCRAAVQVISPCRPSVKRRSVIIRAGVEKSAPQIDDNKTCVASVRKLVAHLTRTTTSGRRPPTSWLAAHAAVPSVPHDCQTAAAGALLSNEVNCRSPTARCTDPLIRTSDSNIHFAEPQSHYITSVYTRHVRLACGNITTLATPAMRANGLQHSQSPAFPSVHSHFYFH